MKENKLVEMWNRIETLGKLVQQMVHELNNLKDLSIGTMSLVKKLPDYDKALKELTKEFKEKEKEKEKNVEQQLDKG
jgi:predicted ATP-grasp superfamily ATP-dependent carboligase